MMTPETIAIIGQNLGMVLSFTLGWLLSERRIKKIFRVIDNAQHDAGNIERKSAYLKGRCDGSKEVLDALKFALKNVETEGGK